MTKKEYQRLIWTNVDPILVPHGFSREDSKDCTYWRDVGNGIFHIILIDRLSSGDRYDINVFATSPLICEEVDTKFPDGIPFTSELFGYLSPEEGVGDYQKLYFCGNPDAFMSSFRRDVAPSLTNIAIPYLDKIQTLEDLIPTIRAHGMLGPALFHTGRFAEAKPELEKEITRLSGFPRDAAGEVEAGIRFQQDLLDKLNAAA